MEIQCQFGKVITSDKDITNMDLEAISIIVTNCISGIKKLLSICWEIPKFSVLVINDPLLIPFVKIDARIIHYPYSSYTRLKTSGKDCCPDLVHEIAHLVYFNYSRQLMSEGLAVSCALIICGEINYPYHIIRSSDLKDDSLNLAKKISSISSKTQEGIQTLLFTKKATPLSGNNDPELYALGGSFLLFLFSKFPANYILPLLQSNETDLSNLFSDFLSSIRNYLSKAKRDNVSLEYINLLLEQWHLSSSNENESGTPLKIKFIKNNITVTGDITANKALNGFALGANITKLSLVQKRCREIQIRLATSIEEMQLFYTTTNDEDPGKDYFYTIYPGRIYQQVQKVSIQSFLHIVDLDQSIDINETNLKVIGLRAFFSSSQKVDLKIFQFDLGYLR